MNATSARRNARRDPLRAMAALLVIAGAPAAGAQPAPPPPEVRVSLSVDADASCATTPELVERVRERSRRIRFVDDSGDIPRLVVEIHESSARQWVAALSVQWPDGTRAERRLTARSCASALDALALLVAMTLDPGTRAEADVTRDAPARDADANAGAPDAAPARGSQDATPEPAPAASEVAGAPAEGTVPVAEPATRTPSTAGPPADSGAPAAAHADAPHPFAVEYLAAGVNAQLTSGAAPRAMPGVGVHAVLGLRGVGLWAPALELQLAHLWVDDVAEPGGDAAFELDSVELGACPLGMRLSRFAARACVAGAVGRLSAAGKDTYAPQAHTKPWASIGGALLLSVALGEHVELQGGVELARPLFRYAFAFRPEVFHRVSGLCLEGHLGAGVRFP